VALLSPVVTCTCGAEISIPGKQFPHTFIDQTAERGHAIAEAGPDKPPVPGLLDTDAQAVSA
jgi:hypothetical protein